ncbi:LexA family transcriptional regulator [Mesotoga sp. BH458_6_3_2_1]|uniref:LexA family protein n=1 Tax=Mesotoga sp. BH458_6_3_2_1 TaxID=1437446 RepID=UPI000EF1FA4A|nr:S24 family peptidase [Mesotoga sp. BH458_6_3_2_1]
MESVLMGSGHSSVIESDTVDFSFTVKGYSMFSELLDGDIFFVLKRPVARNGQILVVRISGQGGVIKYFHKRSDMVILSSENPEYKPIRVDRNGR